MKTDALVAALPEILGDKLEGVTVALGEVTAVVGASGVLEAMRLLRDRPELRFESLIDLCGVDYSTYGGGGRDGPRFAVVCHLLSLANNWRLRVRTFAPDDEFPVLPSLVDVWPAMFTGHPDLRRLLTDYGFIGHPFRKDFPLSGHVEMRYDPDQGRVIYQPVTIEPREITPRIIRENAYAESEGFRKG